MKTIIALLRFPAALAALAVLVSSGQAADAKKAAKPADLQVQVNVPPTWRPFLDDDVAEAFTYRLIDVFRSRGYQGEIVQVTTADPGRNDLPTIEVFLTEWRIDRTGNAQCTFTAALKTPAGEKELGLKTGMAIFWPDGPRWGLGRRVDTANALEDAAREALRDLYKAVAQTGLVAGLAEKK
jgi:hypothetical protein